MTTDKIQVAALAEVCRIRGIREVVFSPGSRSAPLVIAFSAMADIKSYVLADERSAGFFALGIAQQHRRPVAVVCTSGTAVLNLAPAICEAYYQQIPLLILTADRPAASIDTGENQTINQTEIFANYIKASYTLPDTLAEAVTVTCAAIGQTITGAQGPVHINIPLAEPLYGQAESTSLLTLPPLSNKITQPSSPITLSHRNIILCGMNYPEAELQRSLARLSMRSDTIVIAEALSNLQHSDFIQQIDATLASMSTASIANLQPTTLITIGRYTVSKRLRQFIKAAAVDIHYHISTDQGNWNGWGAKSYQHIHGHPATVLDILPTYAQQSGDYARDWRLVHKYAHTQTEAFGKIAPYCDWSVYRRLIQSYPKGAAIHYSNSTPIRYAGLHQHDASHHIYANRGTSGIDGCVSTAAGAAAATGQMTICVTGDIGFIYDSHGLWHKHLSPRLRIIVINNGGGNIFRLIDGPDTIPTFESYFETATHTSIEDLANAYRVSYYFCDCADDMDMVLDAFYQDNGKPAILEIKTDGHRDAVVYKEYFAFLKQQPHTT
jgi:2-succinyl-5-enolpyruvyl-6-hydroxy-3-cyclohexene-1-carboxylate synthase